MIELYDLIRAVPDFPSPGIVFRDITPLLQDRSGLRQVTDLLAARYQDRSIDCVAAVESRGFLFGAPLAMALGVGMTPIRKLGKLPRATISRQYALEYGSAHLELHVDAVEPGRRVLVVDDVLATGGTAAAAAGLIGELGAVVAGVAFLIEIDGLGGRKALADYEVEALLHF